MRRFWARWGFLGIVELLFALSLILPALGDWDRPTNRIPGYGAFLGAVLFLMRPSGEEGHGLILMALSVQANLFLLCGWVSLATPSRHFRNRGFGILMAWGLLSFALALTPVFCLGVRRLLVGYYLWVVSIGLLAGWFWIFGLKTQTNDPSVVAVPLDVGGSNPAGVG